MWTKEIYQRALKEYREIEEKLKESNGLSREELYQKFNGFNDFEGFDVNYKSLTVTFEENENGEWYISNGIEIYGSEESNKYEFLSLEQLLCKANL